MKEFAEAFARLQLLNAHFPGTVIAGGAIRDVILGRTVRDYDFYIPTTESLFLHLVGSMNVNRLGQADFDEQYETNKLLRAVFDDRNTPNFQYMLVTKSLDLSPRAIEEFGCSSSQAMMRADGSIYLHPEFSDFLLTGEILFASKHRDKPKYFNKMKDYFGEQYKLRIRDEDFSAKPAY